MIPQLAIFERQGTGDDIDGTDGVWHLLFKEWVKLTPLTGRELLVAAQIQSQGTHNAEIHWSPTASHLKSSDRFKIKRDFPEDSTDADKNFRVFQIESVINDGERNKKLQLLCVEK